MRQRCNKFLVVPGAPLAQHRHVDHPPDVPVPQSERRIHLSGRERLRLLNQSRHLIDELTTTGADRLCDGPERSQVRT